MKSFLAALSFLTILPLRSFRPEEEDLARSLPWFPVVGLILAALVYAGGSCLVDLFPASVAAVGTVVLLAALTGGLHLDGLADSADGLLCGRSRERMLEIMRDSRIGSMGALALLAVLGLKTSALATLDPRAFVAAAALAPFAGRVSMLLVFALLPSVRSEGLGALFYRYPATLPAVAGVLALVGAAVWLEPEWGVIHAGVALATALVWCGYLRLRLGGATGDTLGACSELVEMAFILSHAARWSDAGGWA